MLPNLFIGLICYGFYSLCNNVGSADILTVFLHVKSVVLCCCFLFCLRLSVLHLHY